MAPGTKKEEKSESSAVRSKKRSASSVSNSSAKATSRENLHADILKLEEEQAKVRSPETDEQLFGSTVDQVKDLLAKILDTKLKGQTKNSGSELTELRIQASMHLLSLKKLNRLDKFRTRNHRDATNQAKMKVDTLHLKLQNLLYEVLHLQKEITKCQQYKSEDEEMDLVSLKQFYADAPEEIAKSDVTKSDPHQQRLARLEFENKQRREMNQEFKSLEAAKHSLEKKIRDKRAKLANLDPQLKKILETCKPVENYLNMPISENKEQIELAKFLPYPLFVLYRQSYAYGDACDENVKSKILGEIEVAQSFKMKDYNKDDDDNDGNEEDQETVQKKKTRGKRNSAGKMPLSKQEEKLQLLLAQHPLKVEVTVILPDGGHSAVLTFGYLYHLKIVNVEVKVELGSGAKALSGDKECLQSAQIFSHLFGPDPGNTSPNPGTPHQLSSIGVKRIPNSQMAKLGAFYIWAQNLAGIEFPAQNQDNSESIAKNEEDGNASQEVSPEVNVDEEVAQTKIKSTVEAIRQRLSSRFALQKQICMLEKAKTTQVDLPIPDEITAMMSNSRVSSKITNWGSVDWEQYTALQVTQHLVQSGFVDSHDFLFRLQVNRDKATLIALIAIKPNYPNNAPIFCLNLHWRGEHNLKNSEHIRALETLINTELDDIPTSCLPNLLSIQLQRLLICLDVLLEAWNAAEPNEGKIDFHREKVFLQPVRGRNRGLPLIYNPNLKLFTQL